MRSVRFQSLSFALLSFVCAIPMHGVAAEEPVCIGRWSLAETQ